jgi:hypothetical protein
MLPRKRLALLCFVAAISATSVVLLIRARRSWDNPAPVPVSVGLDLVYANKPLHVTVQCTCPPYFIQGQSQTLTFITTASESTDHQNSSGPPAGKELPHPRPTPGAVNQSPASSQSTGSGAEGTEAYLWSSVDNNWTNWHPFLDGNYSKLIADNSHIVARQSFQLSMTLGDQPREIEFHLGTSKTSDGSWINQDVASAAIPLNSRASFFKTFSNNLLYVFVFLATAGLVFFVDRAIRVADAVRAEKLRQAEDLAKKNPGGGRYAWELARTRLESHFDRNLFQVNLVFWVAVAVMMAGFLVVVWGVDRSLRSGTAINPGSAIAVASGVITQFLGATFMVLYRSTVKQANDFIVVLDRINNVGMAMQVLDQIPDEPQEMKNDVRARIIESLLSLGHPRPASESADPKP